MFALVPVLVCVLGGFLSIFSMVGKSSLVSTLGLKLNGFELPMKAPFQHFLSCIGATCFLQFRAKKREGYKPWQSQVNCLRSFDLCFSFTQPQLLDSMIFFRVFVYFKLEVFSTQLPCNYEPGGFFWVKTFSFSPLELKETSRSNAT